MAAPSQGDWFADGEAYEQYVGRWSRRVGPLFLDWEGAVQLSGTSHGQPISGSGYVEMTGYATRSGGRFKE